jgi:HlyD family secretion protein
MAEKQSGGWFKWLVILLIAGVVVAGGIWYFAAGGADAPQYQTTVVTRGEIIEAVTANGTLNPVTNITVGSQISGIILTLNADWNSPVTAGQVVAQLDPATYESAVRSAEGDLANAKASLELQQVEERRSSELFASKLISGSDYDTAIATLHQAEAQVRIKEASLTNATVNLQRCTIYSPVDGTVISRNVDVGQTVAASLSAPTLFIIANDLTKMQIDANVSEADIGTVAEGQDVNFTVDAFPDGKFNGRVRQIRNSPTTVQNVVTYDTVIEVSNPDLKLRPGMTANASIVIAQHGGVLKIPNAAFRFRPPETPTNKTFFASLFGGGETKNPATNAVPASMSGETNKNEIAATGGTPLTGNEPPDELQKRVAEIRARGEEVPPEISAKLREYYQSGVLQRPAGGAGARGGGRRGGGAGGAGGGVSRSAQTSRTVYILAAGKDSGAPVPQAVRVRTGISDGTSTEITDGLKDGDTVIIGVKLPQGSVNSSAPGGGASPFGGGGGGRGGGRGF